MIIKSIVTQTAAMLLTLFLLPSPQHYCCTTTDNRFHTRHNCESYSWKASIHSIEHRGTDQHIPTIIKVTQTRNDSAKENVTFLQAVLIVQAARA